LSISFISNVLSIKPMLFLSVIIQTAFPPSFWTTFTNMYNHTHKLFSSKGRHCKTVSCIVQVREKQFQQNGILYCTGSRKTISTKRYLVLYRFAKNHFNITVFFTAFKQVSNTTQTRWFGSLNILLVTR